MRRALLLVPVVAALGGCIPFPYGTYYRPSYADPSAVVGQTSCGGQAGPPARLSFQAPPGFEVATDAYPATVSKTRERAWTLGIDLPPGHTLRFAGDTLLISEGARGAPKAVAPAVRAATSYRLRSDAWIDPAQLAPTDPAARVATEEPVAKAGLGFGRIELSGDVIEVRLPAVEIDGATIAPPPLTLQVDAIRRGIRVFRTKEHLQSVIDREAACKRDAPHTRCENIRLYDADSFIVTVAGLRWKGRFWMMETSKGVEPLQFEVDVESRDARRWRFTEAAIRVRDPAGQFHEQRFAEVSVILISPTTLGAPFRTATTGKATPTRIRLDASLGTDEAARYVVTLPPYEFDGRRYEMKPIEFERRDFDGGLEPFNC